MDSPPPKLDSPHPAEAAEVGKEVKTHTVTVKPFCECCILYSAAVVKGLESKFMIAMLSIIPVRH